jgi:1-deoxy-D-xylulose-5-phosphate reductoisomerase
MGGTAGAVLNAANEEAVKLFVDEKLSFTDVVRVVDAVLSKHQPVSSPDLEQILSADRWARQEVQRCWVTICKKA